MADLMIPEEHQDALVKLLNLPEKSVEELISAFESVTPKLYPEDFAADVVSKVQTVSSDDVTNIVNLLFGLYITRVNRAIPPEELAEGIIEAMAKSNVKKLQLLVDKQESFKHHLIRLLSIETLLILAKALDVLLSNEKVFYNARILTDIRPVFGSNPEVVPNAAVIVHMLNIQYQHNGEMKDFYIAMDVDDIETLREVLNRADSKAQSLKSVLNKAAVTYLAKE